jgi:hypothetical protein
MGVVLVLIYLPLIIVALFIAAAFANKAKSRRASENPEFRIKARQVFFGFVVSALLICALPAYLLLNPHPEPVSVFFSLIGSNLFIPLAAAGIAHGKANESSESQLPNPEREELLTSFSLGAAHSVWGTPLIALVALFLFF